MGDSIVASLFSMNGINLFVCSTQMQLLREKEEISIDSSSLLLLLYWSTWSVISFVLWDRAIGLELVPTAAAGSWIITRLLRHLQCTMCYLCWCAPRLLLDRDSIDFVKGGEEEEKEEFASKEAEKKLVKIWEEKTPERLKERRRSEWQINRVVFVTITSC